MHITIPALYMNSVDQKTGLHVYIASTLPTELSLQLLFFSDFYLNLASKLNIKMDSSRKLFSRAL